MSTTTQTMTNGETSSKTLDHFISYPIVHDTVETYKSYPLGRKSIDLSQTGYEKFVSPMIPYAKGPYSHIAPYVNKADDLASSGLTKVDEKFPIVKQETSTIKDSVLDLAYTPFRLASDGKNYIFSTYGSEYKKCGGEGYISSSKALITTSIVVTSDTLAWLSSFLSARKEETQDFASKKYAQGQQYAQNGAKYAGEKKDAALGFANEKAEQARNLAYMKGEEAKGKGEEARDKAYAKGEEAKGKAEETKNEAKSKSGNK